MSGHWPQLLTLGWLALGFAVYCAKAGEDRGPFNPVWFVVDAVITLSVLYAGGFFVPLGWGQP